MAPSVRPPRAVAGTLTALEAMPELIEILPVAVYACNVEGRLLWFNSRAVDLWGRLPRISDEKYTGAYRVFVEGEERPPEQTLMAQTLSTGTPLRAVESQLERPDGSRVWITTHLEPVRDEAGLLLGAISCFYESTLRHEAEAAVARDLRDTRRLNQLSNRLVREGGNFDENLNAVLDTAIAITGAIKGSLRLLDPTNGILNLVALRGFDEPAYLNLFTAMPVEASAYATVIKSGERLIIEDIRESKLLAGSPPKELIKEVLLGTGVCAVTAVPLIASTATLLGILATHFATPHRPNENELHLMDLLARQTADYLERKRAHEIQTTLTREVQHRSNNLLTIVQAIAQRSLSDDRSPAEARQTFEARLQALTRVNRQLTQSDWSGLSLRDIVRRELEPFIGRTLIEGTEVTLNGQHAQNFSLVLHELATNAAKYGALSNGTGNIGVFWTVAQKDRTTFLKLRWQEKGGPPVVPPTRRGFGTLLVNSAFPGARFDYAAEGLSCEFQVHLSTQDLS